MISYLNIDWLPDKLVGSDYADIDALETAAFKIFQNDWTDFALFRGCEVRVHRHPHKAKADRWHTYWHAVTKGFPEEKRTTPVPDRLERVPWCRPMVDNEALVDIKVWANVRGKDQHVCIWFDRVNYIIILKQCQNHFLLKTTYCPEPRRKAQLHREYVAWKKTGRAL